MNLPTPAGASVLVEDLHEKVSRGGIHLAALDTQAMCRGRVVAVGPGTRLDDGRFVPVSVAVGDVVRYQPYAGQLLKLSLTRELYRIGEADILCVESGA